MSDHHGRRRSAALATALALAPLTAWAQPSLPEADPAARDAAMRQLQEPTGVGGCIYIAVPLKVRREALMKALTGESFISPTLREAVSKVSARCSGRPYSASDHALVGSVVSTFQKAAAALGMTQFGVGQQTLDAAWGAGTPDEKAAFYAVADEFFSPGMTVTPRTLDVGPLAKRAGLDPGADPQALRFLRMYYGSTAMIERAEPLFAKAGGK